MDADGTLTVEQLLTQVDAATAATADIVEKCTAGQWQMVVADEERTVGVVLHHIAYAYPFVVDWAVGLARGEGTPAVSYAEVHAINQQHAEAQANVDSAATLALLKTHAAAAAEKLGQLSDADLQTSAAFALIGGQPISAQQIVQWFLVNHTHNHLAAIHDTLGGA
jgi:hypothetical protein